jgi:hypothetical protein
MFYPWNLASHTGKFSPYLTQMTQIIGISFLYLLCAVPSVIKKNARTLNFFKRAYRAHRMELVGHAKKEPDSRSSKRRLLQMEPATSSETLLGSPGVNSQVYPSK